MKLEPIKPFVKKELVEDPRTRDNDQLLCSKVWFTEVKLSDLNMNEMSAVNFLKMLIDGKLTSPEAITRVRRKLQEHDATLRGDTYVVRHTKQQEVQTQLKLNNWKK